MATGKSKSGKNDLQFDLFSAPAASESPTVSSTSAATLKTPNPVKPAVSPVAEVGLGEIDEKEIERLLRYNENELEAAKYANLKIKPDQSELPKAPPVYSVSEISKLLRDSLREFFPEIIIRGEIADFKGVHRNGHLYFALKDDKSQIRAVMWKPQLQRVPFDLKSGLEVIATCKVDYYAGSGSLQVVVEKLEPVGLGALQLKLEQLKEKLKSEGLFDLSRKKSVRQLNWRIGIVTSKTGAALFDMLRVYSSRFPLAQIYVFHSAVQGEKAPDEIVQALSRVERWQKTSSEKLDVLVLTRGGGSYEDLFCFNDEKIVRALFAMSMPTVSAIGHEIDTTLCDFVADKRSATPSHAASETVPELQTWLERLRDLEKKLTTWIRDQIADRNQKIDTLMNRMVATAPQRKIQDQKQRVSEKSKQFEYLIRNAIEKNRAHLSRLAQVFDALSPLKVLDRGYSIVRTPDGEVVKDIFQVGVGSTLNIFLSRGELEVLVKDKKMAIEEKS